MFGAEEAVDRTKLSESGENNTRSREGHRGDGDGGRRRGGGVGGITCWVRRRVARRKRSRSSRRGGVSRVARRPSVCQEEEGYTNE